MSTSTCPLWEQTKLPENVKVWCYNYCKILNTINLHRRFAFLKQIGWIKLQKTKYSTEETKERDDDKTRGRKTMSGNFPGNLFASKKRIVSSNLCFIVFLECQSFWFVWNLNKFSLIFQSTMSNLMDEFESAFKVRHCSIVKVEHN